MTTTKKRICLHWAWSHAPHLLKATTTGIALCGEKGVPNEYLTIFPKYATCKTCRIAHGKSLRPNRKQTP